VVQSNTPYPTTDGPSNYVTSLYFHSEVVPLVHEPQPLDLYLNHFSAFTHVVALTLDGYRGGVCLDIASQCFSAFRNALRWLKLSSSLFRFGEMSRIVEFFPNIETLLLWSPNALGSDEGEPFPPPLRAVFPRLKDLDIRLRLKTPPLELHLLSGFAEASMDLEEFSLVGSVSDPSVVKKLLDSSAQTLTKLSIPPLGKSSSWCYAHTTLIIPLPRRVQSWIFPHATKSSISWFTIYYIHSTVPPISMIPPPNPNSSTC